MDSTSNVDIKELNEKINKNSAFIDMLMMEMNKVIVGQKHMTEKITNRPAFKWSYFTGGCSWIS